VDAGGTAQIKWNHLSGTATVYNPEFGAYEYNAYAFFVPTGLDQEPVGVPGSINLNGVEYDSCPQYQIGQFSPSDVSSTGTGIRVDAAIEPDTTPGKNLLAVFLNRLAIAGCTLNLNQDWVPVFTKLQFELWNEDEVKYTGAFECADSWHETTFVGPELFPSIVDDSGPGPAGTLDPNFIAFLGGGPIDSAASNFSFASLGTYAARYRIQGVKSTQCPNSQHVGLVAVQSSFVSAVQIHLNNDTNGNSEDPDITLVGTTLAAAGKFSGRIVWDPQGAVPEGGIR
jgi:hypothetical protein